jgi:hypothetical protein
MTNFKYAGGLDLAVAYLERYAAEIEERQEELADELAAYGPFIGFEDDQRLHNEFYTCASNLHRIKAATLAARKAHIFLSEFYADPNTSLRELIDC